MTIRNKEEALAWWKDHAERGHVVLPRRDLPAGPGRTILLSGGYAVEVANGQAWVLKTPARDPDKDLCFRNYWRIVEAVLTNYEPAVVERESAVQLYLGEATPPRRLRVRHARSKSRYTFEICDGLEVQVIGDTVGAESARVHRVGEAEIRVDRPERTLLTLPLPTVREHLEEISVWLRSLIISRPALEAEWAQSRRPVLIRRFAEMARDAGNKRLGVQLDEFLASEHGQYVSRARTGVGSEIVIPPIIAELGSRAPWLARHSATFQRFGQRMTELLSGEASQLPTFDHETLIAQAREAKTYDAYHSTTIEGYQISPEEVSAVIGGQVVGGHDPEEVRARMAVKGYSLAFDRCLNVIHSADGPIGITEQLIQDLYADLFSASVEAGILDAEALRGWRTSPAYLHGARYVPPSAEKVPQLMHQFLDLINEWEGPTVARAALTHLDFVAIHPFPDGNGRLARLLMNFVLMTTGLPWVTIRTDDRLEYFHALETATVDGDPRPFAQFVLTYVHRGVEATKS